MSTPAPMTVVLALDGSPSSVVARDLVAALPWPAGSTIHLLSAYTTPIDWTGGVGSTMDWIGDIEDATRDQLTDELQALEGPIRERGISTQLHVVGQRAADAILAQARAVSADLIVIGSRGRGRLPTLLLGSVAAEVADRAHCSVLVARRTTLSSVEIATDGSPTARAIPAQLAAWGLIGATNAHVVAVAVPDSLLFQALVGISTLGDDRLARMEREVKERTQTALDEMVASLAEVGITATPHLRSGDPANEIIAVAAEQDVDLIVTGSRGLGGLDRVVLGSVARNVAVQAKSSVLVVRAPGAGTAAGS